MAAAGSFAAVSTIFGSPVIGAVLIIEATGLGGAMLPLVLLPGPARRGDRLARVHRARLVDGVQHQRLAAEPVRAAAVRGTRLGRLRLDDPARDRGRRRRLRDHGARAAGASASSTRIRSRSPSRPGSPSGLLAIAFAEITDQPPRRGAVLRAGGVRHALRRGRDALGLDPAAALPLQGARVEHLARELPRRADVPRDLPRRRRRARSPRTCRATPRRRRSRCWSARCACRSCACRCRP